MRKFPLASVEAPIPSPTTSTFTNSNGWRVGQNPMRNWQAAATVWMARDRERPASAETYVPKNKAFYATRPPEQAKDFLKDAALRRQAMRKRREAVTQ